MFKIFIMLKDSIKLLYIKEYVLLEICISNKRNLNFINICCEIVNFMIQKNLLLYSYRMKNKIR